MTRRPHCHCGHRWPRVGDDREPLIVASWFDMGAA